MIVNSRANRENSLFKPGHHPKQSFRKTRDQAELGHEEKWNVVANQPYNW
jgi:hypothetical protein